MRSLHILFLATTASALLLASPAGADGPNTGRNWDDSHMRTRHVSAEPPRTHPTILVGDAESAEQVEAGTLPEATWRSWGRTGQSVRFGRQPAQRRSPGLSGLNSGRSGRGGGSLGSTSRGLP